MEDVLAMLVSVIISFNLLKAGINGAVTYIAYKPLARLLKREQQESAI